MTWQHRRATQEVIVLIVVVVIVVVTAVVVGTNCYTGDGEWANERPDVGHCNTSRGSIVCIPPPC